MISFSSGIMAGLVVFTPGGGYVSSNAEFWKGIVFGVVGGVTGNLATRLKYFFNIDDALDLLQSMVFLVLWDLCLQVYLLINCMILKVDGLLAIGSNLGFNYWELLLPVHTCLFCR